MPTEADDAFTHCLLLVTAPWQMQSH